MRVNQALVDFLNIAIFDRQIDCPNGADTAAAIFSVAKKNSVANVVYAGIEKLKIALDKETTERYRNEKDIALYTFAMQLQQVCVLSDLFEKAQIPFILLKGSRMRELYPSPELRTCGDIDILAKAPDDQIISLMQSIGFTFRKDGGTTLNFSYGAALEVEIHRYLFDERIQFHGYFDTIWDRVQLKDGWNYQYMMTEEDFYVMMIAHFAKHFSRYGCGIRNAIDISVFLKNAPKTFSLEAAEAILKQLDLLPFEQKLLQLIQAWDSNQWTQQDMMLTDYIIGCGTFGNQHTNTAHSIVNVNQKNAKEKKILFHVFPSFGIMSGLYPVLKKVPILLPFCWIARWFRLIFADRKRIQSVLKLYSQLDQETLQKTRDIMQLMQIENINDKSV